MNTGDIVRFKTVDYGDWQKGLLIQKDEYLKVAQILVGEYVFYAPLRLVEALSYN